MSDLLIDKDGDRFWYNAEIKLHRENSPAVEFANGHKEWYVNGLLHRIDGPAVEYVNGNKEYWLNGKKYNINKYRREVCYYVTNR